MYFQHGIIVDDTNRKFVLEPLPKGINVPKVLEMNRSKRSTNTNSNHNVDEFEEEEEDSVFIFVYEPNIATNIGGESKLTKLSCALKPQNAKRLKAPTFDMDELINVTSSNLKPRKVTSTLQVEYLKDLIREKRKIIPKRNDKVIELAVFVDDDLYKLTKKETDKHGGDPVDRIQDVVYAYLNAVSFI